MMGNLLTAVFEGLAGVIKKNKKKVRPSNLVTLEVAVKRIMT